MPVLALRDHSVPFQAGFCLGPVLQSWGLQLTEQRSQSTMVTALHASW